MFIPHTIIILDEKELDIPNGENNAENDEEQEQPEVDEQEYYAEGWFFHREIGDVTVWRLCLLYFLLHVLCCLLSSLSHEM